MMQDHLQHTPTEAPRLTLITDTSRLSGEAFFNKLEQALIGGVDAVLVREKKLTSAKLLAFASRIRALTQQYHARLIIHSQADIAAAVGADGVHLSSAEISNVAAVRGWLMDENMTVSVSCHHADELTLAHEMGADYAMLSPVFLTDSHPEAPPLGMTLFDELIAGAKLPVIALGGISVNVCTVLQGRSLAVIGAILAADDARDIAQQLFKAASEDVTGAAS